MGRTLLPFRPALDQEIFTWKPFREKLSPEDQMVFDRLLNFARKHADAGSLAARPLISEVIFMSIAIEQQKIIKELEERISKL